MLVDVPLMRMMQVTVVQVIGVVTMLHIGVTTRGTVGVFMLFVSGVRQWDTLLLALPSHIDHPLSNFCER